MRLTNLANRFTLAAAVVAWAASAGCQRLPYIDQSKAVPHETLGTIAAGGQGGQAGQLHRQPARSPMPKVAKPRTTDNPEAEEIWQLTLRRRSGSAWTTPRSSA